MSQWACAALRRSLLLVRMRRSIIISVPITLVPQILQENAVSAKTEIIPKFMPAVVY